MSCAIASQNTLRPYGASHTTIAARRVGRRDASRARRPADPYRRHARTSPETLETLARGRQSRARQEHTLGPRPRDPDPSDRLELLLALRVGTARRDRPRRWYQR